MGDPLGHNYELVEPIGYGAFGRVWRAQTRNGELVAAKLLRPEYATDATVRARFVREHTVLSAMRHPHIVGVRDLVIEGEVLALVLEYVDGPSLRRLLTEQGTLAPAEAARLVAEMCDGLAALHAAGILHRDVKPDNVLLQPGDDGLWHAKLGDFGLARMLRSSLTHTGAFTGTFEYAAPELAGGAPATAAADLYSTGIVLYELLCGVTPFHAEHPVTVVQRHQSVPPPRPDGLPDQLWELISWLLAKQPTQRPPDAAVVRDALTTLAPSLADLPAATPLVEPPTARVAVTAAPHEPPPGTAPPTVVAPAGRDGPVTDRSILDVREEEHRRREPSRRRTARPSWILTSAGLAMVAAVLVLTLAISHTTGPNGSVTGQPTTALTSQPTPSATGQPTRTLSTAGPSLTASPRSAPPLLVDSLRSKTRPWWAFNEPGCERNLQADGYHLVSHNSRNACYTWADFIQKVRNVSVATDIAFGRTHAGSWGGVTCRETPSDGYVAMISAVGYVARIVSNPGGSTPGRILQEAQWTQSPSRAHRLRFECTDQADGTTHLLLTVDGAQAVEALDKQRREPAGYVGMYISNEVGSSGVTEVVFTNFSVSSG